MQQKWLRLGQILDPQKNYISSTHVGQTFLKLKKGNILEIFFSHRDSKNISNISKFDFDIKRYKTNNKSFKKLLVPGKYGSFDSHGVSYPSIIKHKNKNFMFYVGWQVGIKNILPFKNNIGISKFHDGFSKISKAPIIPIDQFDPYNTGSCFCMKIKGIYYLWYTSFLKYKKIRGNYRHYYSIKLAKSNNLINWKKNKNLCIELKGKEYSICHPTVIFHNENYHMWFCVRGKNYKIGYARSKDGIKWTRKDKDFIVNKTTKKWDSKAMAYPSVIKYNKKLLMAYTGNDYGRGGIGLLKMDLKSDF